jgi:hypothetical protein
MKLASRDGQTLELRILGYQFPDLGTSEYDSNWLVVTGKVTHSRGSWQFTNPCLLTFEAEQLATWMDRVAHAKLPSDTCDFMEPNLEFRALNIDRRILRVYFDLGARPSWAARGYVGTQDLWVEFPIEELDLKLAAREWHTELTKYPQRAPR